MRSTINRVEHLRGPDASVAYASVFGRRTYIGVGRLLAAGIPYILQSTELDMHGDAVDMLVATWPEYRDFVNLAGD